MSEIFICLQIYHVVHSNQINALLFYDFYWQNLAHLRFLTFWSSYKRSSLQLWCILKFSKIFNGVLLSVKNKILLQFVINRRMNWKKIPRLLEFLWRHFRPVHFIQLIFNKTKRTLLELIWYLSNVIYDMIQNLKNQI